jgi:hypothetical protein
VIALLPFETAMPLVNTGGIVRWRLCRSGLSR